MFKKRKEIENAYEKCKYDLTFKHASTLNPHYKTKNCLGSVNALNLRHILRKSMSVTKSENISSESERF